MIPGFGSQKMFAEARPKKSPLGQSSKANGLNGAGSPKKLTSIEKEEQLRRDQERLAAYGFTHLQKGVNPGNTLARSQDGALNEMSFKAGVPMPI